MSPTPHEALAHLAAIDPAAHQSLLEACQHPAHLLPALTSPGKLFVLRLAEAYDGQVTIPPNVRRIVALLHQ